MHGPINVELRWILFIIIIIIIISPLHTVSELRPAFDYAYSHSNNRKMYNLICKLPNFYTHFFFHQVFKTFRRALLILQGIIRSMYWNNVIFLT